ncbi:MAG TPA: hypothetical protein VF960_14080 [Chloroflexota bacterium]
MDPEINFLDKASLRGEPNNLPEFSRADLLGLGALLAFLAIVAAATRVPSNGLGDVLVSAVVDLVLAIGAVASFAAAISWRNSIEKSREVEPAAELIPAQQPLPISISERRNRNSRAA